MSSNAGKEEPKVSQESKDIFKTMEFTHQNLNEDFNTFNKKGQGKGQKEDKFADFMSIVDEKY